MGDEPTSLEFTVCAREVVDDIISAHLWKNIFQRPYSEWGADRHQMSQDFWSEIFRFHEQFSAERKVVFVAVCFHAIIMKYSLPLFILTHLIYRFNHYCLTLNPLLFCQANKWSDLFNWLFDPEEHKIITKISSVLRSWILDSFKAVTRVGVGSKYLYHKLVQVEFWWRHYKTSV